MPRLGGGTPAIIEHSDKATIREIRFVGREKMKVAQRGLLQTDDLLRDPAEDFFEQEVEFVFAEVRNPARIILPEGRKLRLIVEVVFQLIDNVKIERSGQAIGLRKKIVKGTEGK